MAIDLTTTTQVKALAGLSGSGDDAVLSTLITQVSQLAEEYLGRHTSSGRRTEIYPVYVGKPYVSLRGFPISAVSSVKFGDTRTFSDIESLDSGDYEVLNGPGQIYFRPGTIAPTVSPQCWIEVQYTGGMAADAASFLAAYPGISIAVASEVINRWNRRQNPEGELRSFETGVAYQKPMQMLPETYAALDPHRRLRL